jgi:branched-chain amino acid transport system substrate-binding protein
MADSTLPTTPPNNLSEPAPQTDSAAPPPPESPLAPPAPVDQPLSATSPPIASPLPSPAVPIAQAVAVPELTSANAPLAEPGANIAAPTTAPQTPNTTASSRRSPLVVIGITIVVIILLGLGGFATYAYLSSRVKPTPPSVKVGVLMAFTGGSSSMGYGEMKGIQLAQKQLDASNIELVQMDSQCDPAVAPQGMQRLIDQQVVAVIGDGCSSASLAALSLANSNKIPMVSPSASSPTLSISDDYFFRVVPPDTYQGAYLAKAVYARGIKSVGIFYTNEPYGANMNNVFTKEFESLGGKVLTSVNAQSGVINLAPQIGQIKAAKPQGVVFVSNSVVSGAAAIELARQAGIAVPFFGGDGLYDQTLISNAQAAAQGLTITTFPTGNSAFRQLLLNNDQGEQLYAAAQGYDAFEAIYQAVKHGARNGLQIKNELPNISFDGVSAPIKFAPNGDEDGTNYKYALLKVQDGSFVDASN